MISSNPSSGFSIIISSSGKTPGNIITGASFLLLSSLAYFGLDLRDVFGDWWKRK